MSTRTMRWVAVVAVAVLATGTACSSDPAPDAAGSTTTATTAPAGSATTGPLSGRISVDAPDADRCDPFGGERCLLPFPNDHFTVADDTTDTGRRVAIDRDSTPANAAGVHIDPAEQNRNDGFSPGAALMAMVPGVDLERSGAAPITDMGASLDDDAPIVVVDAETGDRHPYFAEMDANAPDDESRLLMVRPARNFLEGHRYVVGFRGLVDTEGQPVEPADAFRAYRDSLDTEDEVLEARRPAMEQVFADLDAAGVAREDLQLAWDFTVASAENLSERLLHMRDDSFQRLGDAAPAFTVDQVEEGTPDSSVLRTVTGTFEVPRYLTGDGASGSVLTNGAATDDDPLPQATGVQQANFICVVPRSALDGPSEAALYGHGLLGSASEVKGAGSVFTTVSNTTFCATDWIGMATEDVPTAVELLGDLSNFRTMPDRLQQGIVHFLYLGRLLLHPDGFESDPAFQDAQGAGLLDNEHLSFIGVSQGGILGGAASAVAQDWDRALLGVPGMNYSLLLNRSIDFDSYGAILEPAYPDAADRQLGLGLVQMLWDRGENSGYAAHLTSDPYPDTQPKQVLLFEAFGDHQVANVSTEMLARTIGAQVRQPALEEGRSPDTTPFWDIPAAPQDAEGRSYLVMWDFGTPAPPTENLPNRAGEDPHGKGRDDPVVLDMVLTFLREGRLEDVCTGEPCFSDVAG